MIPARLSDGFWASVLQWSRLGANALVFLIVARFLSLPEIGAFATAAAPLRFFQVIHKSGIEESVVIRPQGDTDALFMLSFAAAGVVILLSLTGGLALLALRPDNSIAPMLMILSLTSLAYAAGAVPDGILRREGKFRALALRTLAAQLLAALATVAALAAGLGAWSLVIFTLVNAALSAAISVTLARHPLPCHLPTRASLTTALHSVQHLSARVLIGAALQPILQIGVGALGGLATAGAFQLALRMLALIEAVTLAPLRFLALPRFSRLSNDAPALQQAILNALGLAGVFSAWVYLGVAVAAPDMLAVLVGGANAAETVPVLRLLCLSGLGAAGAAVINQALIGTGKGAAAFRLAILNGTLTLGLAAPLFGNAQAVAAAITVSGLLILAAMLHSLPRWFGIAPVAALGRVGLPYLAGAAMVVAVAALNHWLWADWPLLARLSCQIAIGSAVYIGALHLLLRPALPTLLRPSLR